MIFILQVSSAIFWFWICWKFESYNLEEFLDTIIKIKEEDEYMYIVDCDLE